MGQTEYVPSVPIDKIEQGSNILFEENETEVIVTFTDDPEATIFLCSILVSENSWPLRTHFTKEIHFSFLISTIRTLYQARNSK